MTKARYMILDTETNGFLKKNMVSNTTGRLLQIAWALYTSKGSLIAQKSFYVRPRGYELKATEIHGITDGDLNGGILFPDIIPIFLEDLKQVKVVVGHNILFDESVLCNELNICGQPQIIDLFNDIAWICTQKLGKQLYGRLMNLSDIYQKVLGYPISDAHNAIYDVLNLGQIVTVWLSTKTIKTSFVPFNGGYEWQKLTQKEKDAKKMIIATVTTV